MRANLLSIPRAPIQQDIPNISKHYLLEKIQKEQRFRGCNGHEQIVGQPLFYGKILPNGNPENFHNFEVDHGLWTAQTSQFGVFLGPPPKKKRTGLNHVLNKALDFFSYQKHHTTKTPREKIGLPLRPGDSFGELALLYSVPSSVRVTWKADSTWFVGFFFGSKWFWLKKDDYSKEFQFQDLGRLVKWFFIGQSSPRCGFGLRCFAVVSKHLRYGSMLFRFFAAIHDLWNAMLIWCHGLRIFIWPDKKRVDR